MVCCSIIPPHLLRAIAESRDVGDHCRSCSHSTLERTKVYLQEYLDEQAHLSNQGTHPQHSGIIPGYITRNITESSASSDTARDSAARTLLHQQGVDIGKAASGAFHLERHIYDAKHNTNQNYLPGQSVRNEGQTSTDGYEKAANDTYDNLGRVWDFYAKVLKRDSIDGKGLPLIGTIHFGSLYGNAFWNGKQMVFGDGDNELLYNFTGSLDVIGHELTHGVTEHTANLNYQYQSGALNESVSDVFGETIAQYVRKQTAEEADWLIGEDCILPTVRGVALRSMKAPGTAYNDKRFGKDPQAANMSGYQELSLDDDQGGVHINSGIPNKAFYNAAIGLGGNTWDKAAPIW